MQVEYATDIAFKKQSDLNLMHDHIIRTAIHSVKPDNVATFLGQRLTFHYEGEAGNNSNTRIRGTRIKHRMGEVSIKMYDKFGEVKHKDGTVTEEKAPMKKSIYCLFVLSNILKAANRRYLEFISTFDDPSDGLKNLGKVSKTVESSERTYKGFNFFNEDDQKLLEVLARGEFNFKGIQNKTIRGCKKSCV